MHVWKITFQLKYSHYKDKTLSRVLYINNGNPMLGKTIFIEPGAKLPMALTSIHNGYWMLSYTS